jgi:superoxide dismutase, Cu-Zn family
MRRVVLGVSAAALILSGTILMAGSPAQSAGAAKAGRTVTARASATLKGDGITGTADFSEVKDGTGRYVEIEIKALGLKPGLHGVHLHAVGKCDPDFTAAGGHFDPGPAGNTDPDVNHPFHMGDIPNIEVDATGTAVLRAMTSRVTLSAGPLSLMDEDGSAVIVHGNEDKGMPGPAKSGVSGGPRIACGVIEKKM